MTTMMMILCACDSSDIYYGTISLSFIHIAICLSRCGLTQMSLHFHFLSSSWWCHWVMGRLNFVWLVAVISIEHSTQSILPTFKATTMAHRDKRIVTSFLFSLVNTTSTSIGTDQKLRHTVIQWSYRVKASLCFILILSREFRNNYPSLIQFELMDRSIKLKKTKSNESSVFEANNTKIDICVQREDSWEGHIHTIQENKL